jgi:hypothetical protein
MVANPGKIGACESIGIRDAASFASRDLASVDLTIR